MLDAAHIDEHDGPKSDGVANGLLLRVDLHRLFDAGLLAIHPERHTAHFALQACEGYEHLQCANVALPLFEPPNMTALRKRWREFEKAYGA